MKFRLARFAGLFLLASCTLSLWAEDAIPKISWKRGIGEPLSNPGTRKPQLTDLIDDGYYEYREWHPSCDLPCSRFLTLYLTLNLCPKALDLTVEFLGLDR